MAARLLDRLKRSLFKDGQGAEPDQDAEGGPEAEGFSKDWWETELEEEEECVTEQLRGTLCFDGGEFGAEEGGEGMDSDSDFLGESMEEGFSSTDASPVGVSPFGSSPSSMLTRQVQDSWRSFRGLGGASPGQGVKRQTDSLLFEVTDASVVQDGASKYVLYTIHVIQSGGSDKTPAVITHRYSDFQRLHATLRRNYGDQMERVSFPRKKLRRNFTAETIAKRSRAFEQYLSHLCSLPVLRGALSLRQFFYLRDLQAGQLLIRAGRFQEALGPLLNAKRLQHKLGWASYHDNETQPPSPASSHWFFTLVGLSCCFQEVEQLEEAQEHCEHALRMLIPSKTQTGDNRLLPPPDKPLPLQPDADAPQSLLQPLLKAVIRLSWQTGRDKQRWEQHLQQLELQQAGLDEHLTVREFLVKHKLQENDGDG
ncbi:sorting nexin-21 [Girardinichthys multiradiatus]|uniref:sorting nexin-21 n=1 Tax=Girardinichthys multiradiatus TaxID=208333 RepID=UPI001FAC9617|nr:sorting nexin-21 [Girardinichthys multiradiatus]XP_047222210.1 sorting nexin-21 [Girardinichthys multiradiatus]XP_047222218.1 sorting nexin-21 [Girardinichthys multiradiatus]XP_047222227.1 sorting nexin-21 [Girardinichthys multiradiatus]XP_047222235.1 sorting nexin-21 [Girardinichthys multiradiatus]XP_047222242.1 sorting nexin-21 [Girardinichthys multiradiatus]